MKRALITVLSLLFVFGITASVFAADAKDETKVTLGGELRFRGESQVNVGDFNDDRSDKKNAYDGRVRLSIQAETSKNTTGLVQLESNNGDDTSDTYVWGGGTSKGTYTEGNSKRGDMRILQAWIQTKNLVGTPLGLKIGHMPLKLGNGLFLDHSQYGDDAIMLFMDPSKELNIALVSAKATEGTNTNLNAAGGANHNEDDTNVYALLFSLKGGGFNLSGDATYLDDQNAVDKGLHFWNYGVRTNSKIGPIGFKADIEYQSGKAKNDVTATIGETKYKGYALLAGINFDMNPITLDAEMVVGSGDSNSADNKSKQFVTSLSSTQYYTYVYDYRARTAGTGGPAAAASALGAPSTGIANTTYYKVGASAKPTKDLSASLNLYWLKATKAVSTGNNYTKRDIGKEIDAKIVYQIEKNLVYFVEGGYLMAGDLYKNITENDTSGNPKSPDNAYAVRHGVTLTF